MAPYRNGLRLLIAGALALAACGTAATETQGPAGTEAAVEATAEQVEPTLTPQPPLPRLGEGESPQRRG